MNLRRSCPVASRSGDCLRQGAACGNHQRERVRDDLDVARQLPRQLSVQLKKNISPVRGDLLAAQAAGRKPADVPKLAGPRGENSQRVEKIPEAVLRVEAVDVKLIGEQVRLADHLDRAVVLGPGDTGESD